MCDAPDAFLMLSDWTEKREFVTVDSGAEDEAMAADSAAEEVPSVAAVDPKAVLGASLPLVQ